MILALLCRLFCYNKDDSDKNITGYPVILCVVHINKVYCSYQYSPPLLWGYSWSQGKGL